MTSNANEEPMPQHQHSKSIEKAPREKAPSKPRAEPPCSSDRQSGTHCPTVRAMRPPSEEHPVPALDTDEGDPSLHFADVVDRTINYAVSRLTLGLSPAAVAEAYFDWL